MVLGSDSRLGSLVRAPELSGIFILSFATGSGGLHWPLIMNPSRLLARGLTAFGDAGPWPGFGCTWIGAGCSGRLEGCSAAAAAAPPRTLSFSSPARDVADSDCRAAMEEALPVLSTTLGFAVCFRNGSLRSSAAVGRDAASVVMHRSMNALTSGLLTSLSPSGGTPCARGERDLS